MAARKPTPHPSGLTIAQPRRAEPFPNLKAMRHNLVRRHQAGLSDSGHPLRSNSPALHAVAARLKLEPVQAEREVHGRRRTVWLYPTMIAEGADICRYTAMPGQKTPHAITLEEL